MPLLNNYREFVLSRYKSTIADTPESRELAFNVLGMVSECGEAGDVIKKMVRGDKDIDPNNFVLECGDVLYYMTKALNLLGYTIEDAMERNILKLEYRDKYGKGIHV